jgi:hypothetical protein
LDQCGVEQPKDVKLVGHEAGAGEETAGEALVRVAHVEGDEPDVVAAIDVPERCFELFDRATVDDLHDSTYLLYATYTQMRCEAPYSANPRELLAFRRDQTEDATYAGG